MITLIANTGIQFYDFSATVEKDALKHIKFKYVEGIDHHQMEFWLEELIEVPESGKFATKSQLIKKKFLDSADRFKEDIDLAELDLYDDGADGIFEISNINQTLKWFGQKWIPLPYFKNNNINKGIFGPTDWVRLYFKRFDEDKIEGVLAIDTTVGNNPSFTVSPYLENNPNENKFDLCADDDFILNYFHSYTECRWVNDHIRKFFPVDEEASQTKHIASFIHLVRFLRSTEKLPTIHLLSDKAGIVDVDLVVDVGNSRTCALLFENPNDQRFHFNKVKKLKLRDLSAPLNACDESFSTKLVFKDAEFGALQSPINQNNKFQWPSPVRLGPEAERVINSEDVGQHLNIDSRSYNSSPKRYLWDTDPVTTDWIFHEDGSSVPKTVYLKGISQQLKSDGTLATDSVFGNHAWYSRRSLMTFVYLEIFTQALCQINSAEFRISHGSPTSKRRIKRIIISCPTAMIKEEQIALRKCAEEAMQLINNYSLTATGDAESNVGFDEKAEIIPSVKDLNIKLDSLENRQDWNYDEATASQLVYMYGLILHKYDGNPDIVFNLYGKKNTTDDGSQSNRAIVLGSLDIGGGTSDLMICKYNYKYQDVTEIIPMPLYWESFNLAGDDLLKNVIQRIIIEGALLEEKDKGCTGQIENHARGIGTNDIAGKLNSYFGRDTTHIDFLGQLMRVNFVNQIGIPIALKYMGIANGDIHGNELLIEHNFNDFFPNDKPSKDLLDHFEKHFKFRFEDIKWILSTAKINRIIVDTFSKLIDQVSQLMYMHGCDLVIISGRPTSFNVLEKLFLRNHAVAPNRLVNLNNYWVGRWYPFADSNGYIADSKTVVALGSLIAYMGSKQYKLDGFRIDTTHLKNKLVSTADYIGVIDDSFRIRVPFIDPKREEETISVMNLPFYIGFKRIDAENYPARNLYHFQFNEKWLKAESEKHGKSLSDQINWIGQLKTRLRGRLPFKITVSRDYSMDKELLKLEGIVDKDGEDVTSIYFTLKLQTLSDEKGYWFDSGEFTLAIDNRVRAGN